MKYPCFAIRDIKQGFGYPRLNLNEAMMKRQFGYEINQEGSLMEYAPSDYELYKIGEYDTDNGRMYPDDVATFICNGTEVYGVNEK